MFLTTSIRSAVQSTYLARTGDNLPDSAFCRSAYGICDIDLCGLAFNFYDGAQVWDEIIESLAAQGFRVEQKHEKRVTLFQD